jgi:opacity protein-like surface antigen
MARVQRVRRLGAAGLMVLSLAGVARATEPATGSASEQAPAAQMRFDDTGRLYFTFDSGLHFTLDRQFAGDVKIEPPSGLDWDLGGSAGYNITRNWGAEVQFLGNDPDLSSPTQGAIREISVLTVVPAVRYRWPLDDGRLMPYVTGGVGASFVDVHDANKVYADAKTSSTTIVGSFSAGLDYFLTPDISVGLEMRYLIHPNQDAEVIYQNPQTRQTTRYADTLNLTSVSLLARLKFFPGQQASADGSQKRTFFLADHGPFDTDERRFYLSGLFGYYFFLDKDLGSGVRLRDQGGDANLTKGGALGVNFDGHWGAEVQLLITAPNIRLASGGPRFAKLDVLEVLPTVRYRWQFLDGRLVPFLTAGLGAGFPSANDVRPHVEGTGKGSVVVYPNFDAGSPAVVGSVGFGAEYFLNHYLSVGLDVPFHFYSKVDTELRRQGHKTETGTANLSGPLVLLQLKAYLP